MITTHKTLLIEKEELSLSSVEQYVMTQSLLSAKDSLTKHDKESVNRRPKNRNKKREPVYEDLSKTTQRTNLELIMANTKGVHDVEE